MARVLSHNWTIEAESLESTPMRLPSRVPVEAILAIWLAGSFAASPASAAEGFVGTRSLGMGETLRGAATSGTGPLLNPSGMSLTQSYNVEADYFFAHTGDNQYLHASIVDSTSGYKLAGGLYYTYHSDNPDGPSQGHGHEVGLALSLPFGEHVTIGGTGEVLPALGRPDVARGRHGRIHLRRRHHAAAGQRAVGGRRRLQPARSERRRGAARDWIRRRRCRRPTSC